MPPYCIEVVPAEGGWRWTIISHTGRTVWADALVIPCSLAAFNAGKAWRASHMNVAASVDDYRGQ